MYTRTALRTTRNLRILKQVRHNSAGARPATAGGQSGAVAGGIAGAVAALTVGYAAYHFSGARAAVKMASETKATMDSMKQKVLDATPEPKEALRFLRQTTQSYAAMIPGAKPILDSAFDDLDKLSAKHGDKVDKLVTETYNELKGVATKGSLDLETANKAWGIMQSKIAQIKELAAAAGGDLVDQHPELKKQAGARFNDLKRLAEQYGPEAQKEVDEMYNKVQELASKGLNAGSIGEITKLANDKFAELKQKGEDAYNQGFEKSIKPLLAKSPEVSKFFEDNQDAIKSGDIKKLIPAVKKAIDQQDFGSLQQYVDQAKSYANNSGLGSYLDAIPSGSEIMGHFKDIHAIADKHGEEAKKLSEDTLAEVKQILTKRAEQARKIAEQAKKDL
ncbi:hypothetical protein BCR37DRAFT_122368 [Protomyces lactucae-debilis]|uniref:Uncharacterized protein n=1 Tax=Protomyces lactucae-debilis TaxID=2754530 RepID=A0A1Y2F1M1_PROLT|nr:uncharacterized protein BCR37DRAFT_122368 [Protomyces lactucae-debilis]ORY77781.1 hypothetical protein BCR37DRAFT_122368 [Protomyces lactucae-debilis]